MQGPFTINWNVQEHISHLVSGRVKQAAIFSCYGHVHPKDLCQKIRDGHVHDAIELWSWELSS